MIFLFLKAAVNLTQTTIVQLSLHLLPQKYLKLSSPRNCICLFDVEVHWETGNKEANLIVRLITYCPLSQIPDRLSSETTGKHTWPSSWQILKKTTHFQVLPSSLILNFKFL